MIEQGEGEAQPVNEDAAASAELKALMGAAVEADGGMLQPEQAGLIPEQAAPAAEPDQEIQQALTLALGVGFGVLAPNWQVSADECEQLGGLYAALFAKYFPDSGGQFGLEISALIATGMIFAPRLGKPRKLEPKLEPKSGQRKKPELVVDNEKAD